MHAPGYLTSDMGAPPLVATAGRDRVRTSAGAGAWLSVMQGGLLEQTQPRAALTMTWTAALSGRWGGIGGQESRADATAWTRCSNRERHRRRGRQAFGRRWRCFYFVRWRRCCRVASCDGMRKGGDGDVKRTPEQGDLAVQSVS